MANKSEVETRLEAFLSKYNRVNGANLWHDRNQDYACEARGAKFYARVNGIGDLKSYIHFITELVKELNPWKVDLSNHRFGAEPIPSHLIVINTDEKSKIAWIPEIGTSDKLSSQPHRDPSRRRWTLSMGYCRLVLLVTLLAMLLPVLYALLAKTISGGEPRPTYK